MYTLLKPRAITKNKKLRNEFPRRDPGESTTTFFKGYRYQPISIDRVPHVRARWTSSRAGARFCNISRSLGLLPRLLFLHLRRKDSLPSPCISAFWNSSTSCAISTRPADLSYNTYTCRSSISADRESRSPTETVVVHYRTVIARALISSNITNK